MCTEIQVSSHNTYVYFVLDNLSPMPLLIIGQTRCHLHTITGKTCVKRPLLKYHNLGFEGQLSLNAGQKYCRMFVSALLSTFIKLPFVIKIFVLSIFEWPFNTYFTVRKKAGEYDQECLNISPQTNKWHL